MKTAVATSDISIEEWHIESTELSDGSKVYDLIGASDEARVVINCVDWDAAVTLQTALNFSGASAEAI